MSEAQTPQGFFDRTRGGFIPAIALFGALVVGVTGIVGALYEDALYKAQKLADTAIQARILAESVTAALAFDDDATARQYLNALEANPELVMARVYDDGGKVVAQYSRQRGAAPPANSAVSGGQIVGNSIEVVVPVTERGQRLGRVYLRTTIDSPERRLLKYGIIALIAAMVALLLVVLGTAQYSLSRINRQLAAQARDLSASNQALQNEMRERVRIEEALRQSQKVEAIGQLSGGIAHDFNNFLMIIKGNLDLLQRRLAQGRPDYQRYIDGAVEGVQRAVAVTQRVLAFSRRQPLSPEPNNLSDIVRDALQLVRQSIDGSIEIETDLRSTWCVYCDTNQMENVVLNLAINARDAMPGGGRLVLSTKNLALTEPRLGLVDIEPGDYVELLVQDSGVGMSEEVRNKALDPFYTTKPQGKGTGLGLSTTFGYIRQSGGYLDLKSEEGKGTTVCILMPRQRTQTRPGVP